MSQLVYQITHYDDQNKSLFVTFEDGSNAIIGLRNFNGQLPSTPEQLEALIKQFAPSEEAIAAGAPDLSFISTLVGEVRVTTRRVETPQEVSVSLVPQVVSRFQARAVLLDQGLLPAIESYMADANTPEIQRLAWNDATEFRRNSPTVLSLASLLELTEEQLDNLFIAAATIAA